MICPKCQFDQPDGGLDCMKCGIIFAKFRAPGSGPSPESLSSPHSPAQSSHIPPARMTQGAGLRPAAITPESQNPGIFGAIPCPQCGAPTTSQSGENLVASHGGMVGMMLSHAFTAQYFCPEHGEIDKSSLPHPHRNAIFLRKFLMVASAMGIFIVIIWILAKLESLGYI